MLHRANHAYYVLGSPEMSDAEYDKLFRELQKLEEQHPHFRAPDSPTQRIGAEPASELPKHRHRVPMLSLANAFDDDELDAWEQRIANLVPDVLTSGYQLELKIDGAAVNLTYENGSFTLGATRGNGTIGENVTANLKTIPDIPLRLQGNDWPGMMEIRGEVYFPLDNFARLNARREAEGLERFANPRNTVAGSLRLLNSKVTRSRGLRFFAFQIESAEPPKISTQHETLDLLASWGFSVAPHRSAVQSLAEAKSVIEELEACIAGLNFEADGVVVKVDRLELRERLGVVGGREPRWAIARKFAPEIAVTELRDIRINVGRTGALNPYAVLDPVEIGGVTVSRATLHNMDLIEAKDIRVGDFVEVTRAGEVIPQVLGPVRERRPPNAKPFEPPRQCPACGSDVEQPAGEIAYYCTNDACPARVLEQLTHYASRGAMDIRGLGGQRVQQLNEAGLVDDVADLYELLAADLENLDGFAARAAAQLIDAVEASKAQPLSRLLFALGIEHVGGEGAKLLAGTFGTMDAVMAARKEDLASIDGIGDKIAAAIVAFFAESKNRALIERLRGHGVTFEESAPEVGTALAGQTFVITGKLPNLSRAAANELIERSGGRVMSSVSKNTTALVVGEAPGDKLERAKALGVEILDEASLLRRIGAAA